MADLPDPVEDLWRTYWLPLITDGGQHAPSLLRIKGELFDAFHLIDRARAVYRHVTGGATDDLTLEASVVSLVGLPLT
jgi:hypothetical protein